MEDQEQFPAAAHVSNCPKTSMAKASVPPMKTEVDRDDCSEKSTEARLAVLEGVTEVISSRQRPSALKPRHEESTSTVMSDHLALIANMNDGNMLLCKPADGNQISPKMRHDTGHSEV